MAGPAQRQALRSIVPAIVLLAVAGSVIVLIADRASPILVTLVAIVTAVPVIVWLQRGWSAWMWGGRVDRARARAEAAPSDPDAQCELGVMLALRGEMAGAKEAFEKARSLKPGHAQATVGLGHLAADADDLEHALALFEEAAAADPSLFAAHYGLGCVQLQREQYARAVAAFEKALVAAPNDGFAHIGLAKALYELGEHDRAREHLVKAREAHVTDDDLVRDLSA